MRFVVAIREVHVQLVEVDAASREDAITKVAAGGGTEIDDTQEFSHRLPPDTWTAYEDKEPK